MIVAQQEWFVYGGGRMENKNKTVHSNIFTNGLWAAGAVRFAVSVRVNVCTRDRRTRVRVINYLKAYNRGQYLLNSKSLYRKLGNLGRKPNLTWLQ